MANLELALVDVLVVELRKSGLSLVWGLETYECVSFLFFINREHLDALNLSVSTCEKSLHVVFGHLGVEVFHVQIASLLGVLVFDGLTNEFLLTLISRKSGLNVEDLAIAHVSSIESLNSSIGMFGSILVIVLVFSREADESKVSNTFFLDLNETCHISEFSKEFPKLFVIPFFRVVLYIKVVEEFSDIGTTSWVPFDGNATCLLFRFFEFVGDPFSISSFLIADETISSGGMVFIPRDLERFDWSWFFWKI